MAQRTYEFGLRLVLKALLRYATRWQTKLQVSLTEGQYTCLLSVIEAVTACVIALGEPTLGD